MDTYAADGVGARGLIVLLCRFGAAEGGGCVDEGAHLGGRGDFILEGASELSDAKGVLKNRDGAAGVEKVYPV